MSKGHGGQWCRGKGVRHALVASRSSIFNTGHAGQISVANPSLFLGFPGQLCGYHTGIIFIDILFLSLIAAQQPYCPGLSIYFEIAILIR